MNKIARIIVGVSLTVLTIASSIVGFSHTIIKQETNSTAYKNWMSTVADNTLVEDMNIPGTHDTMALYSIGDLAGKCQSLSLSNQLNIGVRFLDIRLQLNRNELRAVHGIVDQRSTFKDIALTVESFLELNSSEFIIMSVKEENDPKSSTLSFEDALKEYVNEHYWYTGNTMPTKIDASIRGKIILLSRYKNSTIGIPAYSDWKDNCSFTLNSGIYVQDKYKLDNVNDKKQEIETCFAHDGLKINFLSGYLTGYIPPSYAPSVANEINPWINSKIKTVAKRGIVLYDFVTTDLMKGWFE